MPIPYIDILIYRCQKSDHFIVSSQIYDFDSRIFWQLSGLTTKWSVSIAVWPLNFWR